MKSKFSIIHLTLALCLLSGFISCNKTVYNSSWCAKTNVDSLSFSYLDMNCDVSSGIYYKVSNTDSLLILEICILNEFTQQKVMMKGLTVLIDTNGKSKKETGFVFPHQRPGQVPPEGGQRPDPFSDAGRPKIPVTGDILFIRAGLPSEAMPACSVAGLNARMQMNKNNVLLYRVAFDYRLLGFSFASMSASPFSITIMTTPLQTRPAPEQDDPNGAQNAGNVAMGSQPMRGSSSQTPYYSSSTNGYGDPYNPGNSGMQTGGGMQDNSGATKTDRIVIKNIVLKVSGAQ